MKYEVTEKNFTGYKRQMISKYFVLKCGMLHGQSLRGNPGGKYSLSDVLIFVLTISVKLETAWVGRKHWATKEIPLSNSYLFYSSKFCEKLLWNPFFLFGYSFNKKCFEVPKIIKIRIFSNPATVKLWPILSLW